MQPTLRTGFRIQLALSFLLAALALPMGAQPCPTGVSNVSVEFLLAKDADGTKERRELTFISTALATELGISDRIDPDEDINPQIRVVLDAPSHPTLDVVSTANFTVAGTFPSSSRLLRVYAQEDTDPDEKEDEDAGVWKLIGDFPSTARPAASALRLTVYPFAPSISTTLSGNTTTTQVNLCEPASNSDDGAFVESAEIRSNNKDLVILAPHGGEIEEGTSEMVDTIADRLDARAVDADLWKAEGTWQLSDPSERWHITSGALQEASWPSLQDVIDEPNFDDERPYRYSVSLHGFGWSGPDRYGVVLGGQTSPFEKCYIVRKAREAFAAIPGPGGTTLDRSGDVAFYVFNPGGYEHSFPNRKGQRIEAERSVRNLRGLDSDNIVNRLSPNRDGHFGKGGIQIEVSNDLRDEDDLREALAEGVGDALADLLDGTAGPFVGTGCSFTVASATPAGAEIGLLTSASADTTERREEARISTALANDLGLTVDDFDSTENDGIFPQIRVVITSPARTDGDLNEGQFTVTGTFPLGTSRVDVNPAAFLGDEDSGEFKLLSELGAGSVEANVYGIVPAGATIQRFDKDGDLDSTLSVLAFQSPNPNGTVFFNEHVILHEEREAVVLVPNGDLSPALFQDVLLDQGFGLTQRMQSQGVLTSLWAPMGNWPEPRVFAAWHLDDRSHHPRSFPGLADLMDGEYEKDSGIPFRRALSINTFSEPDPAVIVGGQGDRDEKCYLVDQMQRAVTDAGIGGSVGFYMADPGGDLRRPNGSDAALTAADAAPHAGDDERHVVNRLGEDAFLVTESDSIRDDATLRDAISNGLSTALAELAENGLPTGFSCSFL